MNVVRLSDSQNSSICFIQRPDTLRADALPAFVPVFAPCVTQRWAQAHAAACPLQALGQSTHGIRATLIGVQCQDNRLHVSRKPVHLCSSANQRYYFRRLKACCQQRQAVKGSLDQDETLSKLLWFVAKPACRVGLDPAFRRMRLFQQCLVSVFIHTRLPAPQAAPDISFASR